MLRTDYRDDMPAIEVKDRSVYWGAVNFEPYLRHMSEEAFGALYEQAREGFWADAQTLATEFGYGQVYSAGRSGGWLTVEIEDGERFAEFAEQIEQLMDDTRAYLLELVREAASDETHILRGEA